MLGVFLDTETNGLDLFQSEILEIAFTVVNLVSGKELEHYNALIKLSLDEWKAGNPESLAFTEISWDDLLLEGKPKSVVREEILDLFRRHKVNRSYAVFICQNPSFDRIFFSRLIPTSIQEELRLPYNWLDLASMFFAKEVAAELAHKERLELSKDKIAEFYQIGKEKRPHRASRGVEHLIECYRKVVGFPMAVNNCL